MEDSGGQWRTEKSDWTYLQPDGWRHVTVARQCDSPAGELTREVAVDILQQELAGVHVTQLPGHVPALRQLVEEDPVHEPLDLEQLGGTAGHHITEQSHVHLHGVHCRTQSQCLSVITIK